MLRIFTFFLTFFLLSACQKTEDSNGIPKCIHQRLTDFKKECCESGASVKEYHFQEKTVYVFDPGTCGADLAAVVCDEDCNTLGLLGGFAGNTKINNDDFSKAVYQKTIWKQ